MKHSNATGKGKRDQKRHIAVNDAESLAMSIDAFCRRHGISVSKFFELPETDRPATLRLGRRVLITTEAAAEWRARLSGKGAA